MEFTDDKGEVVKCDEVVKIEFGKANGKDLKQDLYKIFIKIFIKEIYKMKNEWPGPFYEAVTQGRYSKYNDIIYCIQDTANKKKKIVVKVSGIKLKKIDKEKIGDLPEDTIHSDSGQSFYLIDQIVVADKIEIESFNTSEKLQYTDSNVPLAYMRKPSFKLYKYIFTGLFNPTEQYFVRSQSTRKPIAFMEEEIENNAKKDTNLIIKSASNMQEGELMATEEEVEASAIVEECKGKDDIKNADMRMKPQNKSTPHITNFEALDKKGKEEKRKMMLKKEKGEKKNNGQAQGKLNNNVEDDEGQSCCGRCTIL